LTAPLDASRSSAPREALASPGWQAIEANLVAEQRHELSVMVTEAGLSRMYGGIHYRFDIEAGQALGRSVARFTMRADRSGHSVLRPALEGPHD
jgi:PAP2 superfamily